MNERRPAGRGSDEAPMGGSGGRGVLLLAVAVVLGIVVLQATDQNEPPSASVRTETSEDEATSTSGSGSGAASTTIRALRAPAQVKVLPANGTQTSGLGARVADTLKGAGYTNTLAAVDATSSSVAATEVQFTVDFGPEAQVVAAVLGLPATAVKPVIVPPVRDSRGADVIVLVGNDLNRSAPTTAAGGGATTPTTAR